MRNWTSSSSTVITLSKACRETYAMYGPLVRTDDGIIAFHDIVPDFKTRYRYRDGRRRRRGPQVLGSQLKTGS